MEYLVFDIGNSDVVIAGNKNDKWETLLRIPSDKCIKVDFFISEIRKLKNNFSDSGTDLKAIIISSVVPKLTQILPVEIEKIFGIKPFLITSANYGAIEMTIDNPHEIGSDLVANAVAAHDRFRDNVVVVDFGTALTFTVIDKAGKILGVAIAPGVLTAMKSLVGNTALLPEIPLELPDSVIGKNTVHAMQAGIMYGYAGLVEGVLKRIRNEIGKCKIISTGGLSQVMTPLHHLFDTIEPHLTLEGMKLIYISAKNSRK